MFQHVWLRTEPLPAESGKRYKRHLHIKYIQTRPDTGMNSPAMRSRDFGKGGAGVARASKSEALSSKLETTYYEVCVNGSGYVWQVLAGGPCCVFLDPNLASRCGVIRLVRSPIILHAGCSRRAGAMLFHGLSHMAVGPKFESGVTRPPSIEVASYTAKAV